MKVNYNGREAEATPVDVVQSNETWIDYLLEDGAVVRVKPVLMQALRIENVLDPQGNPVYMMQHSNVMSVSTPPNNKGGLTTN